MEEQKVQQPNWEPAIVKFFEFVNKESVFEIVDPADETTKRPFMPLITIQRYLDQNSYQNLNAILKVLFPGEYINPKEIVPRYTRVFCTLLYSEHGHYIKQFKRHNQLKDVNLPFHPDNPPNNLLPPTPGLAMLWHDICNAQWRFSAPELEFPVPNLPFEEERVLPITYKKRLDGGGTATLWLIKLHPDYNKLISDESKSRLGEWKDTFVLKEYDTNNAQDYYENETAAFDKVESNENIIGYYGCFTRGGKYHVILEFADQGNLKDFFEKQYAPATAEDIIQLWEGLFQLIDGLRCIHTVEPFGSEEGPRIFQGWHQDIKPQNILVVSGGSRCSHKWKFKLADLGISHFRMATSPEENSTARDRYGTRTYGAPECSRPDEATAKTNLTVNQNVDIWSLGCVFSEMVRWLVFQKSGISDYREERKAERKQKHIVGGGVDSFHDGEKALDAVRKSHDKTLRNLHKGDTITDSVIHMIRDMLVDAPDRPTANSLWRRQLRYIEEARAKVKDNEMAEHSRSQTLPLHLAPLDLAPGLPTSTPGQKPELVDLGIPEGGDDGIRSREVFEQGTPLVDSPFGQPGSSNTSFYARNLTTPPDSDEAPITSPVSQQEDLYGSSPPRGATHNARVSDLSRSPPTPSRGHGATGSSTSNKHDLSRIDLQNGDSPSRPNSLQNPGTNPHGEESSSHIRPNANPIQHEQTSSSTALASPSAAAAPPRKTETVFTIDKAMDWKHECKRIKSKAPGIRTDYQARLKGRDHVFLIDDSASMTQYWDNVVKTFEALSYIVKETDKDGLDLHFTISGTTMKGEKTTRDLVSSVKAHIRRDGAASDIRLRLTSILESYSQKLEEKKRLWKRAPKPLSLYILTDGVWEESSSAEEPITNVVRILHELRKSSTQIGIQLISFGTDEASLAKLRYLDDKLDLPKDIVDTEPWTGDVWKMLLGPINRTMDNRNTIPATNSNP